MNSNIDVTGHRYWIPIPLDVTPENLFKSLMERFGATFVIGLDANVAAVVGAARLLQQTNVAVGDDGLLNLAGWALTHDPDGLEFWAVATLAVTSMQADATADDCVNAVIGDQQLFQTPVVETMETMSGDAISLRYRPMVEDNQVHQSTAVMWLRPEQQALYLLTNYCTDLVEAGEIGDLLDELGAGVKGL